MKINGLSKEIQEKVRQMIEDAPAEKKSDAILEAIQVVVEERNKEIISQILQESERAKSDAAYRESLGLHVLSKEEKDFYELLIKDPKQAITTKQVDVFPETIIERTMQDIREKSDTLSLVRFAPAGVMKWIAGSHSGKGSWGNITAAITGELSAEITGLDLEANKYTAFLVVPKSIRQLSLPFVDKYFRAILEEAMEDGLIEGYLNGNGKTGPVGIMNKIESFKSDGTAAAKSVITVTKLSPAGLKEVRKTLSNNGKRKVSELELICNPLDEAEYVDPALYGEALTGGYRNTSFMPINKHVEPNCPQGKAIFTINGAYVMGVSSVEIKEYDQTKALEDADVIIGKVHANGRADDDNAAVVIDVTQLEEYVLPVTQVTQA